jgi:hypothetical protein
MITSATIPPLALAGNPLKVTVLSDTRDLISIAVPVDAGFTYRASAIPDEYGSCAFFIDDLFDGLLDLVPPTPGTALAHLLPASVRGITATVTQGGQNIPVTSKIYPGRVDNKALSILAAEGKNIFEWKLLNPTVNFLMTSRSAGNLVTFRESELQYIYFIRQNFNTITVKDTTGHSVTVNIPAGDGVVALDMKLVRERLAGMGSLAACLALEIAGNIPLRLLLLPSAADRLELLFKNAWGVHEIAELSGVVTLEPQYAASDTFNSLDTSRGIFYKKNPRGTLSPVINAPSGYRTPSEMDFLADMLLSDDAYLSVEDRLQPVLLSGKLKRQHPLAIPSSVDVKITASADERALTPLPPPPPKYLSVNPTTLYFPADGTEGGEASVLSSSPWRISARDSWIQAFIDNGVLYVAANENLTTKTRQGSVTIVNDDNLTAILTVSQAALVGYINVDPSSVFLPVTGTPAQDVIVNSNITWYVHGKPDWASVVRTGDTLSISAQANTGTSQRSGSVLLANADMSVTRTITVTQASEYMYIAAIPDEFLNVPAEGSDNNEVAVDANVAWDVIESPDFVDAYKVSDTLLSFDVAENAESEARTGYIILANADASVTKSIRVTQAKGSGIQITPHSLGIGAAGGVVTFNIITNKYWEIMAVPDWVTLSAVSGEGDEQVTATLTANTGPARSATVTGVDEDGSEAQTVINQDAADYYIYGTVEPADAGMMIGDGHYEAGQEIEIGVSVNAHYGFEKWQIKTTEEGPWVDYGTDEFFNYIVTGTVAFKAILARTEYNVVLNSSDQTKGTVSGGGWKTKGSNVQIVATPLAGHVFTQWSDGNTQATRTLTNLQGDITLTAVFDVAPFFNMSPSELNFPKEGGTLPFTINSNRRWNLTVVQDDPVTQ